MFEWTSAWCVPTERNGVHIQVLWVPRLTPGTLLLSATDDCRAATTDARLTLTA